MKNDLERAFEEGRRRDVAESEWLGASTQGRPTFAEAELLDRRGTPACHVWTLPKGEVPGHLAAIDALRLWQAGACAMCSASRGRLLVDHCHEAGLVRGLLCGSCNTSEGLGNSPAFAAYRERPPAVMLGLEEQYGSVWDGFAARPDDLGERNAVHVDAAEALFGDVASRFRPDVKEAQ